MQIADPVPQGVGVATRLVVRLGLHRLAVRIPEAFAHVGPVSLHLDDGDAVVRMRDDDVHFTIAVGVGKTDGRHDQPPIRQPIDQRFDDHPLGVVLQRRHRELRRYQRSHAADRARSASRRARSLSVAVRHSPLLRLSAAAQPAAPAASLYLAANGKDTTTEHDLTTLGRFEELRTRHPVDHLEQPGAALGAPAFC